MKNLEKYVDEICKQMANNDSCYLGADCDECEFHGICCDEDALKEFMLKEAEDDPLLDEPQGTV